MNKTAFTGEMIIRYFKDCAFNDFGLTLYKVKHVRGWFGEHDKIVGRLELSQRYFQELANTYSVTRTIRPVVTPTFDKDNKWWYQIEIEGESWLFCADPRIMLDWAFSYLYNKSS